MIKEVSNCHFAYHYFALLNQKKIDFYLFSLLIHPQFPTLWIMKTQLLKHAWLEFRRSPTLTRNIVQTIFIGLFALYFILLMMGAAVALRPILKDMFPEQDLLLVTGGLIGYYFVTDILMRYFIQKFPALAVKPYLPLPFKKSGLSHYVLFRSLGSFFNILPLFFLVPFFFKEIIPAYPAVALNFALFTVGMVLLNNYLSLGISKYMSARSNWAGIIIVGVMLIFYLEYEGYFSLFNYLKDGVALVLSSPLLSSIPLLLASSLYLFLHRFFREELYLEKTQSQQNLMGANLSVDWFDRFGDAGKLMDLELKLILRSKRARAYLITSVLFMLYPLFFMSMGDSIMESPYMLLIIGLFLTGMVGINHGQILLSWNSLHFDLLMSRGHTIHDIFKAKYYFLALACLLFFAISIPYVLLNPKILLFSITMLLYNLAFSLFAYLFLASYTALRVDPNEGGAFSFDGFGVAHYLIMFPIMFFPFLLYFIGDKFGGQLGGLLAIAIPSILMLIFYKSLLSGVVKNFRKHRHKIAAAFRQ